MLDVPVLHHELLTLEPLSPDHLPGITAAAADPQAAAAGFTDVPTPDTAGAYLAHSLEQARAGHTAPFAICLPGGRVVGHTAFLTPRFWPGTERLYAVEIGSSYLHADVRGTAVNTVAKLLMMTHAFEHWQVGRLDIKTDARNPRARAGIEAVGGRFEGILAGWQPSRVPGEDGRLRDTAMYAVTAARWPEVQADLTRRIAAKAPASSAPG